MRIVITAMAETGGPVSRSSYANGSTRVVGKYMFPIVQKLGLTSKKTVNSFDEVLFLTGNI